MIKSFLAAAFLTSVLAGGAFAVVPAPFLAEPATVSQVQTVAMKSMMKHHCKKGMHWMNGKHIMNGKHMMKGMCMSNKSMKNMKKKGSTTTY